ncbi:MAG: hypothetical protein AAF557_06945 [Pseudomonadota bacterium]
MQEVRVHEDHEGLHPWSRIEETFVLHRGREHLDCRLTHFHDGTVQQDDFVAGALRHRIIGNNGNRLSDAAEKPWDQIELRYDDRGSELRVTTFYSDGGVRNEMFHIALWHDQVPAEQAAGGTNAPLKNVTVDYDANGVLVGRHFFHVDGAIVYERYENGILSEVLQELAPLAPGMTKHRGWSSIVQCFDSNGLLTRKLTVWDDGSETEEIFEDAELDLEPLAEEIDQPIMMHKDQLQDIPAQEVMVEASEVSDDAEMSAFETPMAKWLQSKFGGLVQGGGPRLSRAASNDQALDFAIGA